MINPADLSGKLAIDVQDVNALLKQFDMMAPVM